MDYRKTFYNSITVNLPKNVIQFTLGVALYWLYFGSVDFLTALVALIGFLLTYSSVYMYNDIIDRHDDKKHEEKLKWKPVANGNLSVESAMGIYILLLVSGLFLSFMVNRWFATAMVILVFLNFLHSSTFTHWKKSKPKTVFNMTLIEMIKYSAGWFALTTNISDFPFWIIFTFSIAYTVSYMIYKIDFRGHAIKQNKAIIAGLGIVLMLSYGASVLLYPFPLALVLMVFSMTAILMLSRRTNFKFSKMSNTLMLEYVILPMVILCFISLSNPVIAGVNTYMVDNVNTYKETFVQALPDDVTNSFEELIEDLEKYERLDDIEKEINQTFMKALAGEDVSGTC